MKKLLVITLVAAAALFVVDANAFRRGCNTGACEKPCAKKACVDTICTKEIVNVPATQEVTRKVTTETSVGPIQCESCDCEAQHQAVCPDGGFANGGNANTAKVVDVKRQPSRARAIAK